jgi:RNA polymerase sigma-54 factor
MNPTFIFGELMAVKMNQSLKQTQNLLMTPQLQQAIKLLTLTHLEMTNVISQEMVENPMLEEANDGSDPVLENLENKNQEASSDNFSGPELIEGSKDQFDWQSYVENYNNSSSSSAPNVREYKSADEMPNYENMISRGMSLIDHLEWQIKMESLPEQEREFAIEIIHNLNEDGYLGVEFDHLVQNADIDKDRAERVLWMVQGLDPVGCACSSLQECLLAQAYALEERVPLVEKILKNFFKEFHHKELGSIQKSLGVSQEAIAHAEMMIHSFNPKPGRQISAEEIHYIIPDIYVKDMGNGEYSISLNDEGVPRLRVSKLYQALMNSKGNQETQEYVQNKLRNAMWLIKSIENRQRTIKKVAQAIVKYQKEFFKKGPAFMKPMVLKDIANEIEMHESTVSRVTTNKYMHTPIGTFELKYFFSAGIGGDKGGVDIASEALKLKIKKLVDSEDPRKPLSDQKIVELLKKDDVQVARRTIAKYREMLHIPSSSKRRRK